MAKKKLKIWLSATTLSDYELGQIRSVLSKYEIVFNQHLIQNSKAKFHLDSHFAELEKCHLFLGLINPKVSGINIEVENIFLEEIRKAMELNIPYWYVVHHDVTFTRILLNDLVLKNKIVQSSNKNSFDIRTIDIYNEILSQSKNDGNLKLITDFFRLSTFIDNINNNINNTNHRKSALNLMLASTVYGFEDQLSKIIFDLEKLNFKILNSYYGSLKVNPKLSNLENCLQAVEQTDWFLGIVRPYYGTGNIKDIDSKNPEDKNITFEEIKKAIALDLPRWFYVHRDVEFCSKIIQYIKVNITFEEKQSGKIENKNELLSNSLIHSLTIDLYNFVTKNHETNVALRNGNWAQEFFTISEAIRYIHTQFSDYKFIESLLNESKNGR